MILKSKKPKPVRKNNSENNWKRDFDLEKIIKNNLCTIIDKAFEDECIDNKKKYKSFNIYIFPDKECKSVGGTYYYETHIIRIYNFSEGPLAITGTTIHELSHHIDLMKNGKTGHQKPFYDIYKKLLFAAFDLKQVSPFKLRKYTERSIYREKNKVLKMIDDYIKERHL